jgi:hypothetical protein
VNIHLKRNWNAQGIAKGGAKSFSGLGQDSTPRNAQILGKIYRLRWSCSPTAYYLNLAGGYWTL